MYPNAWSPPPPPRKTKLTWLWALLGILFFLGVVGIVSVVAFVNAVKPPVDAMNHFLSDVDRGDYAAAYARMCNREQAATPPAEFPAAIEPFARDLSEYEVYSFDPVGRERTVQYSITDFSGDNSTYRATMVREGGAWRVCDFFE
jgi:hypothetical protein